jgi:predicted RNA-binding Zn-ribbon protein involved in translation (DUF1610 family)
MISCSCNDDYEWWYQPPDDFSTFDSTRRKRCVSCNDLIDIGTDCIKLECFRDPHNDIEERIWGSEVQLANKYLCEKCGEIFLNLGSLGYCVSVDNLQEDLAEYWELTGFKQRGAGGSAEAT